MKTLILGGIRSGKSRLAERLATDSGLPVSYLATATAQDAEMKARIEAHRVRRPASWQVIEEPLHLAAALEQQAAPGQCVLVDCLTLWLTNLLIAAESDCLTRERDALLTCLRRLDGEIILVSNETNMGIVPLGELSRRYCDESGALHQEIALICDRVVLTVAGLPHILKGPPL